MEQDQEFVEMVAKAIVNNPEDVRTDRIVDERGVLITLHINQEDMGYVIGRSGQTARAMRTLLKIVGAKNDARVNLKIFEPEDARRARDERIAAESAAAAPTPSPTPAVPDDEDIHQASQMDAPKPEPAPAPAPEPVQEPKPVPESSPEPEEEEEIDISIVDDLQI